MEDVCEEAAELVARVAALDVGKKELVACVRVPHEDKPGRRRQEVRAFATTTRSLLELRDWLACERVSLCVMEATSVYWKPPFYLLEDAVECWVVNARDAKNVPGRAKTDRLDAVWLCKLAERGMLRPSFVPPPWQRELRDLFVPVPAHPDPGTLPGEAAGGEAAGGHPDQAVERDQRHLRQVGAGDAGGADRRPA
jgi:transposase